MGYLSTVAIALTTEATDQFEPTRISLVESYPECFLVKPEATETESVVYLLEDTKWYDDNPLRKAIEEFFEELDDEDEYFYIIVGEDTGDVTQEGSTTLQDYWDLYTQWGLDTQGLSGSTAQENKAKPAASSRLFQPRERRVSDDSVLVSDDSDRVHPPMYQVELMLCWEDMTWSEGEYMYVSTSVDLKDVSDLAIATYVKENDEHPHRQRPIHVTVYNWNPSEIYQDVDGDLVELETT